jgi:uncharacterized damage-inducible protein DinB
MNADAFRQLYEYHFAENRALWEKYVVRITDAQLNQDLAYSHGSIRDQVSHIVDVDDAWFSDLRNAKPRKPLEPPDDVRLEHIRARWDEVERDMRAYLETVHDETLLAKPLSGEDEGLRLWQILLHVVNHGTDHRAQILRALHDLGLETSSQDYVFYLYDHVTED